ncbi:IGF-like family receptor 1 isoform X1 [Acomys russatus]|uniref:IGF-like family receptor 1 isoform X1 n=1 Tax=Acomys russatus TaxID=60746 RepID=UPI0021E27384|nr:IGF-like family receptor 1 isoform X1 [Acomys russatus]
MGPSCVLWTAAVAALLPARAALLGVSQLCGRLEYWNPGKKCCSSCLQRFGPPACPDYEFMENCGINDFGNTVAHPFKKCSPGYCNPNGTELCSQCHSRATAPSHTESPGRTQKRCRKKPTPPKDACPLTAEEAGVSSSPVRWSLEQTTKSDVPRPGFASPSALPLFLGLLLGLLLVLAVALLLSLFKRKARSPPCPSLAGGDLSASAPWPSPGTLEVLGKRNSGKPALLRLSAGVSRGQPCPGGKAVKAVLPLLAPPCSSEPQGLASQPLSRLLDELEVLEELIMLLDPEPGPSGSMAYGTTRHLAARYGLPAAWSTFAYSLRPSRSPLRALIEMVVAREPSATVGQLGMHLAQLGRADALQVLCRLG